LSNGHVHNLAKHTALVRSDRFRRLFLPSPCLAQNQEQSVIRVDVNLVLVDATVKTKAGQIMADLKQDDFELREDGVTQR